MPICCLPRFGKVVLYALLGSCSIACTLTVYWIVGGDVSILHLISSPGTAPYEYCIGGVNTEGKESHLTNDCLTIISDLPPNLNEIHNATVTSAKWSTFELLNKPKTGEYLRVRINARDGMNRSQTEGGDYWVAVLNCPLPHYEASTSASVLDHRNGTYTVEFFIGWPKAIEINITLVHPSRAAKVLNRIRNISYPSRVFWNGTFINGKNQTAHSLCYMDYHSGGKRGGDETSDSSSFPRRDKCIYPNRRALGNKTAFVCDAPRGNFSCSSLVKYSTASPMIGRTFHAIGDGLDCMWLFHGHHYLQRITSGETIAYMEPDPDHSLKSVDKIVNALPPCQPSNRQNGTGFWRNKAWTSLVCKSKRWNQAGAADDIGQCLRHKRLYLLGDSTTRQWVLGLLVLLKVKTQSIEIFQQYRRYLRQYDLNITYQFYPQMLGSRTPSIEHEMYEVDVIDSLGRSGGKSCNFVVVISPWAHFTQWWADAYRERLELLRASVQRFKTRCPKAPVILKGPHVRNHKDTYSQLLNSDYILLQMKIQMEEVFRNTDVFYVNIWDMNLSYPSEKEIHMPREVIYQELSMALSYICKEDSGHPVHEEHSTLLRNADPQMMDKHTLRNTKKRPLIKVQRNI